MKFQQSFIKWACCNCVSEVPIYLGGAGEENVTACIKVCLNDPSDVDSLRNTREEADDRMFHVHQLSLPKTLKVSSLLLVIQMCCLFDLLFQSMDLLWFEGNLDSQWKEWLNKSVYYPSTGGTTRVKRC